jgi:16S rRNA (cytosine1402-N4)-methyltransferase
MQPPFEQTFDSDYHAPVLVREVVEMLGACRTILDCTLGGGGHSQALVEAGATVTGIDRDARAIAVARQRLSGYEHAGRFQAVLGDFTHADGIAALQGATFDGILADLGVSSHQLNDDTRGFSFRPGVPLDMRMGDTEQTAADWLNQSPESSIADALFFYGDEPKARRMAAEIVRRRSNRPFAISDDLVGAIRATLGKRSGPGDFARLFQAVRIAVNNELEGLDRALPILRDLLTPGGRLAIIAYHSGEDRRVKQAMRAWSTACTCPPAQPLCTCGGVAQGSLVTRKAIVPTAEESVHNPRARSAKLRVWQKKV